MTDKISVRLPSELVDYINTFEGRNFSKRLISALSDKINKENKGLINCPTFDSETEVIERLEDETYKLIKIQDEFYRVVDINNKIAGYFKSKQSL